MMHEWILSSGALILAVIALRFVLRGKISLRLQYALWALVLARLLIPFQIFTSTLSVSGAARELEVDLSQPVRQVYTAVQAPRYQAEYEVIYEQILQSSQSLAPNTAEVERQTQQRLEQTQQADVASLLYGIWIAGMAAVGLVLVGCNGHFALRLRRSRRITEDALCLLPVYESAVVPTPCIFGLFRPAVYLPPAVAGDPGARSHVLAHEMTHYRHLDHIWSVLRCVCLVLHWYNPLVWLAFRFSREDGELACDEGALRILGEDQRGDYGRTLIRLSCGEGLTTGLIAATMTGSARTIARRLKTLMKGRRTTLLALIALVLVGTVAIGCTFSGAPETTAPDSQTLTTEDGVIIYPGTAWGMTPEEVKTTLGLTEEDCAVYVDEIRSYGQAVYAFEAENQAFFGVHATVSFVFRSHTPEQNPVLEIVHVELETEADFDAVYPELVAQLGEPAGGTIQVLHKGTDADDGHSAGSIQTWKSDRKVSDYATAEQWQLYLEKYGSVSEDAAASTLTAYGAWDGELPRLSFHSNMLELLGAIDSGALTLTPEERTLRRCMVLFEKEGAVDWYRAATTCLYDDPTQIHLGELFYEQLVDRADLTDAELETLRAQYPQDVIDSVAIVRVTVPEMRAVMEEYFGVSLDACDLGTMEDYLYCAQTEAYLELTSVPNAYDPEFSGGAILENGDVLLYYTNRYYAKHYSDKLCAITLRQTGDVWQILSNRLIDPPAEEHIPTPDMSDHSEQLPIPDFTEPQEGTALTSAQITQVNAAFEPYIPMEEDPNGLVANPIACFFTSYYTDVRELDLREFLRYCPVSEGATEEEYKLLQKLEDFPYTGGFSEMPVPLHRYPAEKVDALLREYTGLGLRERYERDEDWSGLYYLAETDCYYNTTSDAGAGIFRCTGGVIFEDHVELYSNGAVLILREENGKYYIQSHLPTE